MRCSNCGGNCPDTAKFCSHCGSAVNVQQLCSCGAVMEPSARYCSSCGKAAGEVHAAQQGNSPSANEGFKNFAARLFPNFADIRPVSRAEYWTACLKGALLGTLAAIIAMFLISVIVGPYVGRVLGEMFGQYVLLRRYGHLYVGRVLDAGLLQQSWPGVLFWGSLGLQFIGSVTGVILFSALGWLIFLVLSLTVGFKPSANPSTGNEAEGEPLPGTAELK